MNEEKLKKATRRDYDAKVKEYNDKLAKLDKAINRLEDATRLSSLHIAGVAIIDMSHLKSSFAYNWDAINTAHPDVALINPDRWKRIAFNNMVEAVGVRAYQMDMKKMEAYNAIRWSIGLEYNGDFKSPPVCLLRCDCSLYPRPLDLNL